MKVVVLTGGRQGGKTSLCQRIAEQATAQGLRIGGVLSPAVFSEGEKIGIAVVDLSSGHSQHLATRRRSPAPNALGYQFEDVALAWADHIVASAMPCDLFIIDEIGPLEIESGGGIVSAFDVLRDGRHRLALVVVRPELVDSFLDRLGLPCDVRNVEDFFDDVALGTGASPQDAIAKLLEEHLGG